MREARERLCEALRRVNEGILAWDVLGQVASEMRDRIRSADGHEAALCGGLAYLLQSLDDYQRDFEEARSKVHGATWEEERRRIWRTLAEPLGRLEVAACGDAPAAELLQLLGALLRRGADFQSRGVPRA